MARPALADTMLAASGINKRLTMPQRCASQASMTSLQTASEMLLGWQAAVCGLPFDALQSLQWREGSWLCRARTSKR